MAVAERRGGAAEERIGELAGILLEHEEELAEQMDRAIFAAAPVLAGDPTIAAETSASNRANLRRWLTAVHAHPGAPVSGEPPPEAVEVAVSLIRRGMETGPLITAYRAGQNYAWGRWMELAAERIEQRGELIAVLERSSAQMNAYVDRVVDAVLAQAQLEREAMLGGAASRRAETIRMILEGAPLEPRTAASRLGWELDREQVAFVLWHARGAPSGEAREQLEAAAVTLARAAAGGGRADRSGGRALTLPAGSSALWAWIAPASGAPDTDAMRTAMAELPASLRVAVGPPRGGLGGFRRSHAAAIDAQRIAELGGGDEVAAEDAEPGTRLTTWEEVQVVALAGHDPEAGREFAEAVLGGLAAGDEATARLRETARVYLELGSSAPRAAAALHLHRNTVLYRLGRAEELLGRPVGERLLATAVALELHRRLG